MSSSSKSGPRLSAAWLRPSAVEGWYAVSRRLEDAPHEPAVIAVARLKASYATAGADYAAAQAILEAIGLAKKSAHESYQVLIEFDAQQNKPAWLSVLPRGRLGLHGILTPDARECFRRAGAFAEPPPADVVEFLDRLANLARSQANLGLTESGRNAERLSFDLETARCAAIPGALSVKWVALDDNSAGFDILSSRMVDGCPGPKFVEVKSCRSPRLRMIVTRNEWMTACRHKEAYFFHLWDMVANQLHELSWRELEPHMPIDQGDGQWDSATVILSGLRAN